MAARRRRRDRPDAERAPARAADRRRGGRPAARRSCKTPLYEAKVDPDIYFFGFDLTAEEARGGTRRAADRRRPGWFFVIKERPGEPRFGFDIERDGDAQRLERPGLGRTCSPRPRARHLGWRRGAGARRSSSRPTRRCTEKVAQWEDDRALSWAPATMNAADVAYIALPGARCSSPCTPRRCCAPAVRAATGTEFDEAGRPLGPTRRPPRRRARPQPAVDRLARARAEHDAVARRDAADDPRAARPRGARVGRGRGRAHRRPAAAAHGARRTATAVDAFGRLADPRQAGRRGSTTTSRCCCCRCALETRFSDERAVGPRLPRRVGGRHVRGAAVGHRGGERRGATGRACGPARAREDAGAPPGAGWCQPRQRARRAGSLEQYRAAQPGRRAADARPTARGRSSSSRRTRRCRPRERTAVADYWEASGAPTATPTAWRPRDAALDAASAPAAPPPSAPGRPSSLDEPPPRRRRPGATAAVSVAFLRAARRRGRRARRDVVDARAAGAPAARPVRAARLRGRRPGAARSRARRSRRRWPSAPTRRPRPPTSCTSTDGDLRRPGRAAVDGRLRARPSRSAWASASARRPHEARGFDRLLVLGAAAARRPPRARQELETLLAHHLHSRDRLRPGAAGHADQQHRGGAGRASTAPTTPTPPSTTGSSGPTPGRRPRLARRSGTGSGSPSALGIDPAALAARARTPTATDQREARAANVALWPATWGYFLETMMEPVLDPATRRAHRARSSRRTSAAAGRCPRSGSAASRTGSCPRPRSAAGCRWRTRRHRDALPRPPSFLDRLDALLRVVAGDWADWPARCRASAARGDAARRSCSTSSALHPASVEFHQRYAESVEDLFNRVHLGGSGAGSSPRCAPSASSARPWSCSCGSAGRRRPTPDILRRLFLGGQHALRGPLVDDRPLSETEPVRAYTDDGRNYLRWLRRRRAGPRWRRCGREEGFTGDEPRRRRCSTCCCATRCCWPGGTRGCGCGSTPTCWTAPSLQLRRGASRRSCTSPRDPSGERQQREPLDAAVHDRGRRHRGDRPAARRLHPRPCSAEAGRPATSPSRSRRSSAGRRADRPPGAACWPSTSTRAPTGSTPGGWASCTARLRSMRWRRDGDGRRRRGRGGIHLGAYGWLEDVRARGPRELTPVELPGELADVFAGDRRRAAAARPRQRRLHPRAVAQPRRAPRRCCAAGYLANAAPDDPGHAGGEPDARERVRLALAVLEGVRNGQSLGALLGYRLERGLHDRHGLRRGRPVHLRAAQGVPARRRPARRTPPSRPTCPIEAIEARNVVDGLALVRHVTQPGQRTYPFGLPRACPPRRRRPAAAIDGEVDAAARRPRRRRRPGAGRGRAPGRAGQPRPRRGHARRLHGKAGFPPEPAVVATPAQRHHARCTASACTCAPAPIPAASPVGRGRDDAARDGRAGGRTTGSPALLPAPGRRRLRASSWTDPVGGHRRHDAVVTQEDLGLQPIDLLHVLRARRTRRRWASWTTGWSAHVVRARRPATGHRARRIRYTERRRRPGHVLRGLRRSSRSCARVVQRSRPLRATDVALHSEADARATTPRCSADRARVAAVRRRPRTAVEHRPRRVRGRPRRRCSPTPATHRHDAARRASTSFVDRSSTALADAGRLRPAAERLGRSRWRGGRATYADLAGGGRATCAAALAAARWTAADDPVAAADACRAPRTDEERLRAAAAGRAAALDDADHPAAGVAPAPARDRRGRPGGVTRRGSTALDGVADTAAGALHALLAEVAALLPLAAFDPSGLDLTPLEDRGGRLLAATCWPRADAVRARGGRPDRGGRARALAAHDAAAGAGAGRRARGRDAGAARARTSCVVPGSSALRRTATRRSGSWRTEPARPGTLTRQPDRRASSRSTTGCTASPACATGCGAGAGVAAGRRVGPARAGAVTACSCRTGRTTGGWRWSSPPGTRSRRRPPALHGALSRAAVATGDAAVRAAARRVDRGRYPAATETTGLAFHYDRPDSEPPQAMLLVVPPVLRGAWQWDDLVAALHETLDLARTARRRAGARRRHRVRAVPAGDGHGGDRTRHLDRHQLRRQQRASASSCGGDDDAAAGSPSTTSPALCASGGSRRVTVWNRLEGRPRTVEFDRALRAEVRDALWMLTRQWQLGEFRGDDAGSPVLAQLPPRDHPT